MIYWWLLYGAWIVYARRRRIWIWMGDRPPKTGGERYCEEIYQELRSRGMAATAINIDLIGGILLIRHLPGVGRVLESLLLAVAAAWCRGPFIVDEHFATMMGVSNWIRKRRGEKLVILVHHMERQGEHGAGLNRWRMQLADRVICVSQYSRSQVLEHGYPVEQIGLVSPGSDDTPPGVQQAAPPWKLLCVAPAHRRKGLKVVLQALQRLGHRNFELTVVGNYRTAHFRRELQPLRSERTHFVGRLGRAELEALYASSHLFLFPSFQEGFGISLVEAMQSGAVPVVARATALPELVEDGRTGWLFEAGDWEGLAALLDKLLEEPQRIEAMSLVCQTEMRGRFSWERCRREFLAATGDLLEG